MKKLAILAVIGLMAAGAQAGLNLEVNVESGEVTMINDANEVVPLFGYSILSESGSLDPDGWEPTDSNMDAFVYFGSVLGVVSETSYDLTELAVSPIDFPGLGSFSLGMAYDPAVKAEDLDFQYTFGELGDAEQLAGAVGYVPEPMTMSVLGLGGLALLRRRRNR